MNKLQIAKMTAEICNLGSNFQTEAKEGGISYSYCKENIFYLHLWASIKLSIKGGLTPRRFPECLKDALQVSYCGENGLRLKYCSFSNFVPDKWMKVFAKNLLHLLEGWLNTSQFGLKVFVIV